MKAWREDASQVYPGFLHTEFAAKKTFRELQSWFQASLSVAHSCVRGSLESSIVACVNLNQRARWAYSYAVRLMVLTGQLRSSSPTVKQKLHHVKEVQGVDMVVSNRKAHR